MSRRIAALALATGLVGGGIIGGMFGLPSTSGAESTTTTPSSPATPTTPTPQEGGSGTWHSNEDPAHEATESPEREAAEDSGQFRGGPGHHGSNEDPAHEATESPEREAQEDSGGGSGSPTPSTTPASPSATTPASQT